MSKTVSMGGVRVGGKGRAGGTLRTKRGKAAVQKDKDYGQSDLDRKAELQARFVARIRGDR